MDSDLLLFLSSLNTNYNWIGPIIENYNTLDDIIYDNAKKLLEKILNSNTPRKKDQIDFSGNDLIEMGFKEGKKLGEILNEVYNLVMDEKLENKKSEIVKYIKNKYNNLDRNY